MEVLASILACRMGVLPTTYLGLPLGGSCKLTSMWHVVEERFQRRQAI